jgi:hypothetical protein
VDLVYFCDDRVCILCGVEKRKKNIFYKKKNEEKVNKFERRKPNLKEEKGRKINYMFT